jgi:uncharacterized protein (TIGR02594 family)
MNILEIQQALHAKGFDPGPHDGIRGRRTIAAIEALQAANGLVVDGIVGPVTAGRLFTTLKPQARPAVSVGETPWLVEGLRLVDTPEFAGEADNAEIIKWGTDLGIDYAADSIPWCGLFVAHCIGSQLTREPLPAVPLLARAWKAFGNPVMPQVGAILVFWRGSRSAPTGHVGFYLGEEKGGGGAYHVLGGNQSDKVCVTRIAKRKLLEARWPATVPPPAGRQNFVDAKSGKLFNDAG